jgi:dGTPase
VLDGILCHDGELHNEAVHPHKEKTFETLQTEMRDKAKDPARDIWPMSVEGCVVRMADTISYIGRDIEDAIRLGLIDRRQLPGDCKKILGDTNGTIVYNLVEDLVGTSLDKPYVCFSSEVSDALRKLKEFNQEYIYRSARVKKQTSKIELMFKLLFEKYHHDLETGNETSDLYCEFLEGMSWEYRSQTPSAQIVRDFIAGMTDDYFLEQCHKHLIPNIESTHYSR